GGCRAADQALLRRLGEESGARSRRASRQGPQGPGTLKQMVSPSQTRTLDDAARAVAHGSPQPTEGWVERLCRWLCELAVLAMIVMVASEVFLRNVLGLSLQSADELGGYLLVGVSFFSLSTCFVSGAFHKVEFIDGRLGERGHALRRLIFDAMSLA